MYKPSVHQDSESKGPLSVNRPSISVKACAESRNTFETGKSPMRAAAIDRTRQGRQPHRGAFRYWHRPLAQSLDEMTLWDPGGDLLSHIQPVARSTPKPTAMSV